MDKTSVAQIWESIEAVFPAEMLREAELCAKFRDVFYVTTYNVLATLENYRDLPKDEIVQTIDTMLDEATVYCDANLRFFDLN